MTTSTAPRTRPLWAVLVSAIPAGAVGYLLGLWTAFAVFGLDGSQLGYGVPPIVGAAVLGSLVSGLVAGVPGATLAGLVLASGAAGALAFPAALPGPEGSMLAAAAIVAVAAIFAWTRQDT